MFSDFEYFLGCRNLRVTQKMSQPRKLDKYKSTCKMLRVLFIKISNKLTQQLTGDRSNYDEITF